MLADTIYCVMFPLSNPFCSFDILPNVWNVSVWLSLHGIKKITSLTLIMSESGDFNPKMPRKRLFSFETN